MPTATLEQLREQLIALEAEFDAGAAVEPGRLKKLEPAARYWAARAEDGHPIPRLARLLMRAGKHDAARRLLEYAYTIARDDDASIAMMLANAAEVSGDSPRATEVLASLADALPFDATLASRAAEIHWRLGHVDESLALYRVAAAADPARRAHFLNALVTAHRAMDALAEARAVLARGDDDPDLCFACFKAMWRFSKDKDEVALAREHFLDVLPPDDSGASWRARLHRWEQNFDAALTELDAAVISDPSDPSLRRDRTEVALALGYWGRDARAILDGRAACSGNADLGKQIERADALLHAFGGSLAEAAHDAKRFAHVRSPESVFELAVQDIPPARREARGTGLVMIAHSLTAGGAERIVALCHNHLRKDKRFDWVKLYLHNLSQQDGSDFYLPLAGIEHSQAVLVKRDWEAHAPFCFLPKDMAGPAQAIHDQLLKDRPAIVHASLEPLMVYAGLAALRAGVPRIVLHTHNMRPTDLYPDAPQPPRWRDCYRALLGRDEIHLAGCAAASMRDYADWIGLADTSRLNVVYNGLNFSQFRPNPEGKAGLRGVLGIAADVPVVGTAFKFREEKRPILWADAALKVLERHPEARFVLFGDGPLLAPTKAYVAARGAAESFAFPGLVNDLYRWLPMLDLFLLCSSSEALPNVLLEAQASGVPVIARHVGGIGETMLDGETGILVKEDGAEALARALLRAIDDPAWRDRAALTAPGFVRERFSRENMMRSLTKVLLGD
jgi:glycosyltransferase involved in cell wall biosynthesis/tetratricopeptide (TPR) repeat protein